MVLWNGAENKTSPFLLLEWETSSHSATDSTVCPPIWWCLPPDATTVGGILFYKEPKSSKVQVKNGIYTAITDL